jgi:RNA polymerase sigma factor (sigma-70 family)
MRKVSLDIVNRARSGSNTAWTELYESEKFLLEKIVRYRIHAQGDELHSVVNDIFSRVYEKLHTFSDGNSFEPWIAKLAINFCNRYLSNKTRNVSYNSIHIDELSIEKIRTVASPEVVFISNESISKFVDFITNFNERDFQILFLRYVEAYGYEDIVKETRIPLSTVKNVIRKYKNLVKEHYLKYHR